MSEERKKKASALGRLVDKTIDQILGDGAPVNKSWAAEAVRKQIPRSLPDETAWYWLECESVAIDALVGAAIRARKDVESDPEVPEQMVLAGYERLQKFYSVVRDGEQTLVPNDQLSPREVEQKKAEFRRNIDGLSLHLDEFTTYHEKRLAGGASR